MNKLLNVDRIDPLVQGEHQDGACQYQFLAKHELENKFLLCVSKILFVVLRPILLPLVLITQVAPCSE